MRPAVTQALIAVALLVFFGFAVYWEYGIWTECRETNSFWYCVRILSK